MLSNAIVAREKRTFRPLSSLFSAFSNLKVAGFQNLNACGICVATAADFRCAVTFLAGHGKIRPPHGQSTWRAADQPTTRRSTWTHPYGGQISPWPARRVSGVNKSAREQIGRQNLSQKVPSKKGSWGVIFSPRNYRENAHSKSANFEGRHFGGHLLGRPLLFTSESH